MLTEKERESNIVMHRSQRRTLFRIICKAFEKFFFKVSDISGLFYPI